MKTRVLLLLLCTLPGLHSIPSALAEPYTVFSTQKIADGLGNIPNGTLDDFDFFGGATASLGDLDGDGVGDLAVAASGDDSANGGGSGSENGAVYILLLNADGTVKARTKIADGFGGLPNGTLADSDFFGSSCTGLGDLDGDDIPDLAVGSLLDDTANGTDSGDANGALYILFLNANGTVKSFQKIADGIGGLANGTLANDDRFGSSCSLIGDLDGDGTPELAVGASQDDTVDGGGGNDNGAVHILFLNPNGTVKSNLKIADGENGLDASTLANGDWFGSSCAGIGDLDWDGVPDLAVGANQDDTADGGGGNRNGALYLLFLNSDGTVRDQVKIADGMNGLTAATLANFSFFGSSCESIGDINGDGISELAVGAEGDGVFGALYILFPGPDGLVTSFEKIADGQNGLPPGTLSGSGNFFGCTCTLLGDLDGDGRIEIAVGSEGDNTSNGGGGGSNNGAAFILSLGDAPFTVTTAIDELDATSTDGTGVSLREAIRDAATSGDFRRIRFDPSLNGATITLGGTELSLVDLRISVDASDLDQGLTISANDASRIFLVDPTSSLEMKNVTLRDGSITVGSNPQNRGGAIQSRGTLHLVDCAVTGCSAVGSGGGIDILDGIFRMSRSAVSGNESTSQGGGGISDDGESWISNSTISGNLAAQGGGGILRTGSGTTRLAFVTLTGNQSGQTGGGIANLGTASAGMSFRNSIVAENTATSGRVDIDGANGVTTALGANLIGSNESVTVEFPSSALVGTASFPVSPDLWPLGDFGGPTATMPPMTGSPVLDAGPFTPLPSTDQRGVARNDGMPDLGAVEGAFVAPSDNSAKKAKLRKKIRKLKKRLKSAQRRKQVAKVKRLKKQVRKVQVRLRRL